MCQLTFNIMYIEKTVRAIKYGQFRVTGKNSLNP